MAWLSQKGMDVLQSAFFFLSASSLASLKKGTETAHEETVCWILFFTDIFVHGCGLDSCRILCMDLMLRNLTVVQKGRALHVTIPVS